MRASTLTIGRPIEPILRMASSPRRRQVTGLHSVCPNAVTMSACGNASIIARSRVVDAGAAPHEHRRSAERSRSTSPGTATIAAHWAGTKKHDDTCSRSSRSTIATGSNPPEGVSTVVAPCARLMQNPETPAMWNSGAPDRPTRSPCEPLATMLLYACSVRLRWESTAPLGLPVVPEVYMMNAGASSATGGQEGAAGAAASSAS